MRHNVILLQLYYIGDIVTVGIRRNSKRPLHVGFNRNLNSILCTCCAKGHFTDSVSNDFVSKLTGTNQYRRAGYCLTVTVEAQRHMTNRTFKYLFKPSETRLFLLKIHLTFLLYEWGTNYPAGNLHRVYVATMEKCKFYFNLYFWEVIELVK